MNAQSVNSNRNRSMEDDNSDTRLKEHKKEGDDEKVSPAYSSTSSLDSSHSHSHSSSESKPPHSKATTSASGDPKEKDDLPSSSTSRDAQISSLYSSMKLPIGCLREQDGCDEAELRARAERCQEIMNLYEQEKKAEAERIRIANIKPLVWAKPTFDLDSTTTSADETNAEEETTTQAADDTSGKRKGQQDETTAVIQHYSPYHRERLFYKRRRESTPEEVQAFVEFANKWIPSQKRTSDLTAESDDKEETKGEETKSGGTSSSA